MVRAPRAKASLPEDIREHLEYPNPKSFSGVEWRDFAELRERVAKLEQHRDGKDHSDTNREQLTRAIIVAAITVVLTLVGKWAFDTLLNKPAAPQPAVEQKTKDMP